MERPKINMGEVLGAKYEVFTECINYEIAYHSDQLYKVGAETPRGIAHSEAIKELERLRGQVDADDDKTMDAVLLALKTTRADRGNMPEAKSA